MPVAIIDRCNRFQKMDVPVSYLYGAAGSPIKFMKMVFIKVRSESYQMDMVTVPNWNCLSGNSSKTMIMRIFFTLGNFYAALDFMDVALVPAA